MLELTPQRQPLEGGSDGSAHGFDMTDDRRNDPGREDAPHLKRSEVCQGLGGGGEEYGGEGAVARCAACSPDTGAVAQN